MKACLTGDPETGLAILADLYIEWSDITYIFNQGRCLELNQRYDEAIGRFREFLSKGKNLKADAKADARKHIVNCQSYLEKRDPGQPGVKEEPKQTPATMEPAPPAKPLDGDPKPSPILAIHGEPQGAGGNPGAGWRMAGITAGSVGVAGIVIGLILNLKANSMASDLGKSENYSRSVASSRDGYELYSWIGYGTGAACLVGGVVMYYVGWSKKERTMLTIGFLPSVSSNTVGTYLIGAF
jgi:hypothetical protein